MSLVRNINDGTGDDFSVTALFLSRSGFRSTCGRNLSSGCFI